MDAHSSFQSPLRRALLAAALTLVTTHAHAQLSGDFDANSFDDLVIGVPHEDIGFEANAGALHVVYGTQGGPSTAFRQEFWRQGAGGIGDAAEGGDEFGASWAAGDFDHDGDFDLAIGVPGEDDGRGMVMVLYGQPINGLEPAGMDIWTQDSNGIQDQREVNDRFGAALAAGDFNGDGWDDLAIGVPGEDL